MARPVSKNIAAGCKVVKTNKTCNLMPLLPITFMALFARPSLGTLASIGRGTSSAVEARTFTDR